MQRFARCTTALVVLALAFCLVVSGVSAQENMATPWTDADSVRRTLFSAQAALLSKDAAGAQGNIDAAQALYAESLQAPITDASPALAAEIETAFSEASTAVQDSDNLALAAARSRIWANLLHAGSVIVVEAVQANDAVTAANWLILREFRTPTKFSRPGADATLAVNALATGDLTTDAALTAVRDDLLDTYQAKMNESLVDAAAAQEQNFMIKQVEQSALAAGYFDLLTDPILSTAYTEVHGEDGLEASKATFAALVTAARNIQTEDYTAERTEVDALLRGFRAAPLSDAEQARRAGQLLRFVSLIPIEYGRGVSGGKIMKDIEVQEALTFHAAAVAAFSDLEDLLDLRDAAAAAQVDALLATTLDQINSVADPGEVQRSIDQINTALDGLFPAEWKSVNADSDIDVINSLLDQIPAAVAKREYALAESARLEAYAMLEFGIEQRLRGFAPDKAVNIESLFWAGTSDQPGLATLIGTQAALDLIKVSVAQLKLALADAQTFLNSAKSAPEVVASNAAIIIFREGLEAILILASLLASLRTLEERKFRRPIVWGALLACAAWIVTWWLANQLLMSMMQLGERLEAIVSLIAIGVLLIITNWFFHKVYWTGWMANFHSQKRRLLAGTVSVAISQSIGLAILGFTSIYREGFESVLFLQSLVLEAGMGTVLQGVAIGLVGVAVVGVITFVLQMKLPYKKMLVVTGVMIGFVLLVMVGNTVHVMQSVGWLPITPITGLYVPFWVGQWFGVFATWQGIGLQIAAAVFVIGSYFLAERANHRKRDSVVARRAGAA
jgi:high-affinity iron transporter